MPTTRWLSGAGGVVSKPEQCLTLNFLDV